MGEHNEYYAEKMRRLLEAKESEGRIGLDNSQGNASQPSYSYEEEAGETEDFSFDENKRPEPERPRNYEEKRAKVREAEEKARSQGKKRRFSRRDIIISAILVCAILVLGIFCVYKLLFVIGNITVEGNEIYTDEQILASAGIHTGDNLYSFSSRIAEENIKMYCPKVEDIKVKRTPPGKILVTVVEEKAIFYADLYGECRALTKDLRVLGTVTEEQKKELIKLKLPAVGRAVAGETIVFIAEATDYVYEVARVASASELVDRLGTVDLTDPHNVKMTCDGKYILKLKDYKNSEAKLKIAVEVLKHETLQTGNKATIDLSELSNTGVVIDNQLVIE